MICACPRPKVALEVPPPKFEAGFANGELVAPVVPTAANPVLVAESFGVK